MPIFSTTGHQPWDCWLADGDRAFGYLPGGLLPGVNQACPIWLKVGTEAYGERHITKRHGHWVERQGMGVPELVFAKLGQSGVIYTTEREGKLKINLRLAPASLMVLDWMGQHAHPHYSVTTLFAHPRNLDGSIIGRYLGRK